MSFSIHVDSYKHHQNQDTERHHFQHFPHASLCTQTIFLYSLPLLLLETIDLFSTFIVLSFPECHIDELIQ